VEISGFGYRFLGRRDRLAGAMIYATVLLTGDEWSRIRQASRKAFPDEVLSQGEILRRFSLAGTEALAKVSPADRSRLAHEFQASMQAGDQRLKS
jgi:hypothetical protein